MGSGASLDVYAKRVDAEFDKCLQGLSAKQKDQIEAALKNMVAEGGILSEISVTVSVTFLSGETLKIGAVLGDKVLRFKEHLAQKTGTVPAQLKLLLGCESLNESERLLDGLFAEPLAIACKPVLEKLLETKNSDDELHTSLVDACRSGLEAEVQAVTLSTITVSTEEELRKAVAASVPSICIPDNIEITLKESKKAEKEDQEGSEEEEADKTARAEDQDDDEDDEEDEELESVPLRISYNLTLVGGRCSCLRQSSWALCGVRDECALIVDGATVKLEGITLDRGGVTIQNGGSVYASKCHVLNARWCVFSSTSFLEMDSCSLQGSISECIRVCDGAMATVLDSSFKDGGCWSSNILADGPGSKISLKGFTFEGSEGHGALVASNGASITCDGGSVIACNIGLGVYGNNSHGSLTSVVLEGREDSMNTIGVDVGDGAGATIERATIRSFETGVKVGHRGEIHISSVECAGNTRDYLEVGGCIKGVDRAFILEIAAEED